MDLENLGKLILLFALILFLIGSLLYVMGHFFDLKQIPGDIHYKKDGFSFYFPLATCIVLSILITFILNLVLQYLRNR